MTKRGFQSIIMSISVRRVRKTRYQSTSWEHDDVPFADITLYAYTHVAHEGGFDLTAYPAIRAWIKRVGEVPGYVGMLD